MRFGWLIVFFIFLILLILDLIIPDPIPVIDEVILLFATAVSLKKGIIG